MSPMICEANINDVCRKQAVASSSLVSLDLSHIYVSAPASISPGFSLHYNNNNNRENKKTGDKPQRQRPTNCKTIPISQRS